MGALRNSTRVGQLALHATHYATTVLAEMPTNVQVVHQDQLIWMPLTLVYVDQDTTSTVHPECVMLVHMSVRSATVCREQIALLATPRTIGPLLVLHAHVTQTILMSAEDCAMR